MRRVQRPRPTRADRERRRAAARAGQHRADRRHHVRRVSESVTVTLPVREREPLSAVAHLGPTNSGKTHDALQFLAEQGRGVFAAPLRMLAQEARDRLAALAGEERVGLVTGEERHNEGAPILCCTAEMAPRFGHTLVLDEVQWAADPDRGQAWTRLLAGGEYRHVRLLGSPDALPLLRAAFPLVEVRRHDRLRPLDWTGRVHRTQLEPGTVVIAFSRKSVLYLADRLAARYGRERVVALYGAMPVASRRLLIGRVLDGTADIVVATDVLGHGVNLPARTVLFAETDKYDGSEFRPLLPWEAAQIGGRAGRFGLAERGRVGVLTGFEFFAPDPHVARAGLRPTHPYEDGLRGFAPVERGRLRASLDDLGVERADELHMALEAWEQLAAAELAGHPWLDAEPVAPARARLSVAYRALDRSLGRLELEDAWRLASAPLDADHPVDREALEALTRELAGQTGQVARTLPAVKAVAHMRLGDAEQAARAAQAARWCAHAFPEVSVSEARAARLEHAAARRVVDLLRSARGEAGGIGRCRDCGDECPPWRSRCDSCHFARR